MDTRNDNGVGVPAGMSVDAIIGIIESNKLLQMLEIATSKGSAPLCTIMP